MLKEKWIPNAFQIFFTVKILNRRGSSLFGVLKLAKFLEPSVRKRTQNCKEIFRHENEYLLKR